jgi:hypothetical protein
MMLKRTEKKKNLLSSSKEWEKLTEGGKETEEDVDFQCFAVYLFNIQCFPAFCSRFSMFCTQTQGKFNVFQLFLNAFNLALNASPPFSNVFTFPRSPNRSTNSASH